MKKRKIIITLLFLSCVLFIILVFIILNINKSYKIKEDEGKNTNLFSNLNTTNNSINNDNLPKENSQEDEEKIKNIKISIENTPNDIVDKIKDKENFTYVLKKFLYQNNLTEINNIIFLNHITNNNKLYLYYRGYNKTRIYFEIIIDLQNNTTSICFGGD